jgi:hypothetical protein
LMTEYVLVPGSYRRESESRDKPGSGACASAGF